MRSAQRENADDAATVDVLIAGGGPFGLMLANELGRRGVRVALFDAKPSTAVNPQANATQARTMEDYRRRGRGAHDRGRRGGLSTRVRWYGGPSRPMGLASRLLPVIRSAGSPSVWLGDRP